jgi:hypothetical protein
MIISGGIVGSVLLFVVVYAAIIFRNNRKNILPSGTVYTIAFTLSVLTIFAVGVYGLAQLFK